MTFKICGLIISVILFICAIFISIKNDNTFKNRAIIIVAIGDYYLDQMKNNRYSYEAIFEAMEPYHKTLFRLWDWSYKRILPRRKFKLIEPYIKSYNDVKRAV